MTIITVLSYLISWGIPVLLGLGITSTIVIFLDRRMSRYNLPIPPLVWLVGLIVAANLISLVKMNKVEVHLLLPLGPPSREPIYEIRRGWPLQWYTAYGINAWLLMLNIICWTVVMGMWVDVTTAIFPYLRSRYQTKVAIAISIIIALGGAFVLSGF
jgi:hypothetical protein